MVAQLLDGKVLAQKFLLNLSIEIAEIKAKNQRIPTLAVILVGEDQASLLYVKNKKIACQLVGINSLIYKLASTVTQIDLLQLIEQLNADPTVDAILLQLPLVKHLDSKIIIDSIDPDKDVDGFHRYNMGSLAINNPKLRPCTPQGIMFMLDTLKVVYAGSHAIIIGNSNIVGRPMALELINRGATVSICNSKTHNLSRITQLADILIVAVGKANLVQKNWLKLGAIVIDVGINRLADGSLVGDVDFIGASQIASWITPVPRGVGPMTIAMLLNNTMCCYRFKYFTH